MSSNIDIQKKCKWCGEVFTAHSQQDADSSERIDYANICGAGERKETGVGK